MKSTPELEVNCGLAVLVEKCDSDLVLLNDRDIATLRAEEIKAELDRRGQKYASKRELYQVAVTSPRSGYIFVYRGQSKRVCCQQGEKLQSKASASYANEAVSSLQSEMTPSREKVMQSCYTSMKEKATTLRDENKSLMTAI